MNIVLANILSCAATVASSINTLYTKKQFKFSEKNYFNDYRSSLSQSHFVYRKALIKTQKKHKNDLYELSILAGETLTNITRLFDRYDINIYAPRYLRHLLHESSEMVFYTFQGQLAWQTAINISDRLYQISFIEDKLDPLANIFGEGSFRKVIKSTYTSNPNNYLEMDLVNDIYFCNLVSELKSRINYSKIQELMTQLQNEINKFNQLHHNLKIKFTKSANYLEKLINQGNKEHFQLRESPQLFNEINKVKTTLETLGYINRPKQLDNHPPEYYLSRSIYLCTLLHAIESLHSWGWSYE